MKQLFVIFSYYFLFCILLLASAQSSTEAPKNESYEPAFPSPFYLRPHIHIVTEIFDPINGYSTSEDYVDLSLGKAAYIESRGGERVTKYYERTTDSTYRYKPYQCDVFKNPLLPDGYEAGVGLDFYRHEMTFGPINLFGVMAIWYNVASLPLSYSKVSSNYSSIQGKSQLEAHRWTAKIPDKTKPADVSSSSIVTMTFTESSEQPYSPLNLETITIQEHKNTKTIINILSIEESIERDVYFKELKLPLIYGCKYVGGIEQDIWDNYYGALKQDEHRMKLEIIATNIGDGTNKRISDIMNLEYLSIKPQKSIDGNDDDDQQEKRSTNYQVVRQRGSNIDTKTVIDFWSNVIWTIDYKQGSCSVKNGGHPDEQTWTQDIKMQFSNGLNLITTRDYLWELMMSPNNSFVKSMRDSDTGIEYVYITRDRRNVFGTLKLGRVVRKYWLKNGKSPQLESVTVYTFDKTFLDNDDIQEIYHINVIEMTSLLSNIEKAHVLDLSEECYLDNNKKMKYGIDYSWIELYYPVIESELKYLPERSNLLKNHFYDSLIRYANLGHLRIPKMELQFDETGFLLRLLLLDSPAPHLFYRYNPVARLDCKETDGDLFELTPDVEHCSQLCRLHKCLAMSYCPETFSCILSQRIQSMEVKKKPQNGCTVYESPHDMENFNYFESKLQNIIASLQHINYNQIRVPDIPPELGDTEYAWNLPAEIRSEAREEYIRKLEQVLESEKLRPVSYYSWDLQWIFVPNSFRVEQDPLTEFGLENRKDQLEMEEEDLIDVESPAFHQGLSGMKYNFGAFESQKDDNGPDMMKKEDAYRYTGVNYDQCALACVDSVCSSFSYCKQRQECIITNIYEIKKASEEKFLQTDKDCLISQRDYLSKFNKYQDIKEPVTGLKNQYASNPSECAHTCVAESEFDCLAFTFCKGEADNSKSGGRCLYANHRSFEPKQVWRRTDGGKQQQQQQQSVGRVSCDYYSRSYLADFRRIEYRKLDQKTTDSLVKSVVDGKSVDRCAELCATQLMDCSGFQFCYNPEAPNNKAKQQCMMIESPPKQGRLEFEIDVVGSKAAQTGNLLLRDTNCHLFALRKDSDEAKTRQLAFRSFTADSGDSSIYQAGGSGLSLGGCFVMFISITLSFTVITIGLLTANRLSVAFRSRLDHIRSLIVRY